MAVIWISKSKLQSHVESILIREVGTFLSLLQFGIHKYFIVEKKCTQMRYILDLCSFIYDLTNEKYKKKTITEL